MATGITDQLAVEGLVVPRGHVVRSYLNTLRR